MKKIAIALLFFACSSFIGCQKDQDGDTEQSENTTTNTTLEVSVVSASGQAVSGVSVRLYTSEGDWNEDKNVKKSGTTNAQGKVKFDGLSNVKYWIQAEKGCENNIHGVTSTNGAIASGKANTLSVTIAGTGTMVFKNTSSNPYTIWVNGVIVRQSLNGKTQLTLNNVAVGEKAIRVLQQSGYLFTPTDKVYTGTLSCGGTLTTTFP